LITDFWGHFTHYAAIPEMPIRAQEIDMEIAAVVLFSSVALWFAEEINSRRS
jgi:hypothetical protein